MNVGDIVAIAEEVGGVLTKIPAFVTAVYNNAHGEVVADLHKLETNVAGLVIKESNPVEALPPDGGAHVTSDLTPPPSTPAPAKVIDASLSAEESAYASLSAEDQAAFAEFLASKGDGSPST